MVAVLARPGYPRRLAIVASLLLAVNARADELGEAGGFTLRLDTNVRVSLAFRTQAADPALLANINADDGDRAFAPGPVSERINVVSELSAERDALGFDVSGQGWYDAAYNTGHADDSPSTWNGVASSPHGFAPDVRSLMGRQAELLNAFVRDTVPVAGTPVTVSIGRQTLLWGESLLFPENGIAAAQAPVDEIKSLTAPLAEAREVFLPVTQIVIRAGLGGGASLEFYDQWEWRRDRVPGVGSFLSTVDFLDQGGERYLAAGQLPTLYRSGDASPHGIGQFGVALRQTGGALDWGLYALRADARAPVLILDPAYASYHLAFPRGIGVFGASLSSYVGNANVAAELSLHRGTPLDETIPSSNAPVLSGGGSAYAAFAGVGHAREDGSLPTLPMSNGMRGTSLNAQSSLSAEMPPGFLADSADVAAELAGNVLVSGAVPSGRTAGALAARAVVTLHYYRVRTGLDLSAPLGFGIGLAGRSSVDASQNAGAGFVSAGLGATFHVVWQGSVSLTHFVGDIRSQPLLDRDFATVTVARSF
jgi:hypothetical protein